MSYSICDKEGFVIAYVDNHVASALMKSLPGSFRSRKISHDMGRVVFEISEGLWKTENKGITIFLRAGYMIIPS